MKVEFEMASLKGLRKKSNDDRFVNGYKKGIYYFTVCDGMNSGGYVASDSVIKGIKNYFDEAMKKDKINFFYDEMVEDMIKQVNTKSIKDIENSGFGNIGTTLDFLVLDTVGNICCFAHFGDGRIYRLREKKLECLTLDDKMSDRKSENEKFCDEELRLMNTTNPPSVYLGNERLLKVSQKISFNGKMYKRLKSTFLKKDDVFLITTDGLLDCASDRELSEILNNNTISEAVVKLQNILFEPKDMVEHYSKIKKLSKEEATTRLKGRDNATFFVIKYGGE